MKLSTGLLLLTSALIPVFGRDVICYYGYTQDIDDSPEEDWESFICGDNHTSPGCIGATCGGETASCFKVRYEGEDAFMSLYGCIDNATSPSLDKSWIPLEFTPEEIGLQNLDTKEDSCEDEDGVETLDLEDLIAEYEEEDESEDDDEEEEEEDPITELGGTEADRRICVCTDAECNGGIKFGTSGYAIIFTLISAYFSMLL